MLADKFFCENLKKHPKNAFELNVLCNHPEVFNDPKYELDDVIEIKSPTSEINMALDR